jgi:hypothetical protein
VSFFIDRLIPVYIFTFIGYDEEQDVQGVGGDLAQGAGDQAQGQA